VKPASNAYQARRIYLETARVYRNGAETIFQALEKQLEDIRGVSKSPDVTAAKFIQKSRNTDAV
jgi:hypothetical protein